MKRQSKAKYVCWDGLRIIRHTFGEGHCSLCCRVVVNLFVLPAQPIDRVKGDKSTHPMLPSSVGLPRKKRQVCGECVKILVERALAGRHKVEDSLGLDVPKAIMGL